MKALIALFALLLITPVSAESSFSYNELGALKVRMETAARQFLKNSSEAEIEFRYEQKSVGQGKLIQKNRLHRGEIEQIYCYKIIYRKTPDGRLQYEIKSHTTINGRFSSRSARA